MHLEDVKRRAEVRRTWMVVIRDPVTKEPAIRCAYCNNREDGENPYPFHHETGCLAFQALDKIEDDVVWLIEKLEQAMPHELSAHA